MTVAGRITRLLTLVATITLALCLLTGPGAGQEPGPVAPAVDTTVYLPLVAKAPNTIYGRVTDSGIGAAGVSLELRFFNGSSWSTRMSTTTISGGNYQFNNVPSLGVGEELLVRYLNTIDQSRLGIWETPHLTGLSSGNNINLGSFDIADIELTSPIYGYAASLPRSFAWVRRPATPSDSYKFSLFDIYDYTPKFTSTPLGYTSSYPLTTMPAGFNRCNPYYWAVTVDSPDGGWGGSLWAYEVTFYAASSYPGIYGCVTEDSVPQYNVQVQLHRVDTNLYPWVDQPVQTKTTGTNGIFSFTDKPATGNNQYYYVFFTNSTDTNRLSTYETQWLGNYTDSSSVHIGDFDIADIVLGTPAGGTVSLPAVFLWTPRPETATDNYELDLFGAGGDPSAYWDSLGYTDHFILASLPWGFNPGQPYAWNVWIHDPFGGYGISYGTHEVDFSGTGLSASPSEAQEAAALKRAERLRQERILSGMTGQPPRLMQQHPDYTRFTRLAGQE